MPLASGTRLDHYEILDPVGAGGMGEVYRARDDKLGRDVAIKVLPEAVSSDPDRLARFEREARVLASLNHPNIATLHGMETSGGTHFLVMELVPGETLEETLAHGPLTFTEAVPIFDQIAAAVSAAHRSGIVHRDLKPANVKLTPEGAVKVLDFGLAKAWNDGNAESSPELSHSPTVTREGTIAGTILGTASYMSPEQARGKTVDQRADVWAWGNMLYEALTGGKAFDGETVTDILGSVVHHEPDWSRLPTDVPRSARKLLERCLTKSVDQRWSDLQDARLELAETDDAEPSAPPAPKRAPFVLAALGAAAVTALVTWLASPAASPPRVVHTTITSRPYTAPGRGLDFSPDGSRLAYVIDFNGLPFVLVADLGSGTTRVLQGSSSQPFFSSDGNWIGYYSSGNFFKAPVHGGAPIRIAPVAFPLVAVWSADGSIFYDARGATFRVASDGGSPSRWHSRGITSLLPDGRFALVATDTDVELVRVEDREARPLVASAYQARYLDSGHLLFGRSGNLMAAAFDPDAGVMTSEPVVVMGGVLPPDTPYAVSSRGDLAYLEGSSRTTSRFVWVDRNGAKEPVPVPPGSYRRSRLSPDGSVAVFENDDQLFTYDFARERLAPFTFEGTNQFPVFSRDGETILWQVRGDEHRLVSKRSDGSGNIETLATNELSIHPASTGLDGRLVFLEQSDERGWDLLWVDLDDPDERRVISATEAYEGGGEVSPDGRWVAYVTSAGGPDAFEVFVRPFPQGEGQWQITNDGGRAVQWAHDGSELYFMKDSAMYAVPIEPGDTFRPGAPERLFEGSFVELPGTRANYDVAPDGRFLMLEPESTESDGARIVLVVNWVEELKRLVPAP